jgi:hypothetical protein
LAKLGLISATLNERFILVSNAPMKYWEIIADNLKQSQLELGLRLRRFYWENLATSWRRKPIVISAIPRPPHQRTNHECQIGRPEALMRCAKNLINSITAPMNDKINPQIFSVFGVNMHIGTTSNYNSGRKSRL